MSPLGSTAQVNKNLEFLMRMLGQERVLGKRMKGYERLEEQQHGNMLERARKKWLDQISRDPSINRIMSQRFINEQEGTPNIELDKQLKQAIDDTVGLVYSTSTNQEPTEEMWKKGLSNISDMTLREILAQTATGARQKERLPYEAASLGLRGEELRLSQRKFQNELDQIGQQSHEDQLDNWNKIVEDAIGFLESEGVKKEAGTEAFRAMFSSGKVLDPLSKKDRGQAFSYLMQIQAKLIKGQLPGPADEWFLINVRDSEYISGQLSRIQMLVDVAVNEYGMDSKTAADWARKYLYKMKK